MTEVHCLDDGRGEDVQANGSFLTFGKYFNPQISPGLSKSLAELRKSWSTQKLAAAHLAVSRFSKNSMKGKCLLIKYDLGVETLQQGNSSAASLSR